PLEECFYFLPHRCTPVFQILRAVLVSVSTSVLYTLMMSGRAAAPLTSMPPLPEPAWAIICEVPTSLACPRISTPFTRPSPHFLLQFKANSRNSKWFRRFTNDHKDRSREESGANSGGAAQNARPP